MAPQYEIWQQGAIQGPYEAAQLRDIWERAQWPPGTLWRRCGAAQFSLPEELAQEFASAPTPGPAPAAASGAPPFSSSAPPAAGPRLIPCPACGREVSTQAPTCPGCGHVLGPPAVPTAPISISITSPAVRKPKSRSIYIILGIFLGSLGVHNFYAGRIAQGLVQLLVSVLFYWMCGVPAMIMGIWALVECFTIRADAEGEPFR